jgi:hypothetical protein
MFNSIAWLRAFARGAVVIAFLTAIGIFMGGLGTRNGDLIFWSVLQAIGVIIGGLFTWAVLATFAGLAEDTRQMRLRFVRQAANGVQSTLRRTPSGRRVGAS